MNLETNDKAFAQYVKAQGTELDETIITQTKKIMGGTDNQLQTNLAAELGVIIKTKAESQFTNDFRSELAKANPLRTFEELIDFERAEIVRRRKDGESVQTLATAFNTTKAVILKALEDKNAISKAKDVQNLGQKLLDHYKRRG